MFFARSTGDNLKKFLISIDTEGDNLWEWNKKDPIRTRNAKYLPRFQALCDRYGYKPTYLSNWEMVSDPGFCEMIGSWAAEGRCEVGMHLHAWNTPPSFELTGEKNDDCGLPYLIEFADDIMEAKIDAMTDAIIDRIGIRPISHRAGRWAMDQRYFELLARKGYICDCSVTPHINWITSPGLTKGVSGTDYSKAREEPYLVRCDKADIVEVPLTVRDTHSFIKPATCKAKPLAKSLYNVARGQSLQLRPNGKNLNEMLWLERQVANSSSEYIMFMLHSSEFMPGGSPTFRDDAAVENLYVQLEKLFERASLDFEGETIGSFARNLLSSNSLERSTWLVN